MNSIRRQFPLLKKKINGHPMVYFDTAATSQKPHVVIKAIENFYTKHNSNVHRSINPLAEQATKMYEQARATVAAFLGAKTKNEVIFTRNATESLNIVAHSWAKTFLKKGDRVVLPISEHHSNIVPWLQLKKEIDIQLVFIPLDKKNERLDIAAAKKHIAHPKTKVLAIAHASNVLGIVHPIAPLISHAKKHKVITVVDAAQSASHIPINVQKLGCDFVAISGHKMFGPTGIGVLWGRQELLEAMPPFLGGGHMIRQVFQDRFDAADIPDKFEAGTQNISGAIALARAVQFIQSLGMAKIERTEKALGSYLFKKLSSLPFVTLFGPNTTKDRLPIAPFIVDGIHAHDVSDLLGQRGIITRTGHHCCMPLHSALGAPATVRVSLSIYNTKQEIDILVEELRKIHRKFQVPNHK